MITEQEFRKLKADEIYRMFVDHEDRIRELEKRFGIQKKIRR